MRIKKISIYVVILSLMVSTFILPMNVSAKTIADFEAEVNKLTKDLENKKAQVATNEAEISKIKSRITSIKNEIEEGVKEVERLQQEINDCNDEIRAKNKESKSIIEYYQISNGENSYLEYIFGATSITDMIYRMSVVEQLTDYNDKVMKELEKLIKRNEEKQAALEEKQKELEKLTKELEAESMRIEGETASIRVGMPSVEEQIKAAKANVDYYKSLKCGTNEDIQACQYRVQQASGGGSLPSVNGFYRPIEYGYTVRGVGGGHLGYDMSSSNKSINVYPIATGQLYFVGWDSAGAYTVILRHNINGRYYYALYCHMRSFSSAVSGYANYSYGTSASISNGPIISPFTPLGQMGSTGNSTGPHLHLEMAPCQWHKGGGCTYYQYVNSIVSPSNFVVFPGSWNNR